MSETAVLEREDLLITRKLFEREARTADLSAELDAYRELSNLMTIDPIGAIQRFLDLAIELCPAAGTAGLSELGENDQGEPVFKWTAMSGALASHVGGTTPRDFSPCGLCIDQHHTILVDRPARVFDYFEAAEPAIVEGLIVPLYDTGKRPLGTLWVTSHADGEGFDATDARVLEQLAVQLVLAIKLRRKASLMVALEDAMRDKDILVQEVRHRVRNMIQMTSGLLQLQERGLKPGAARAALREAQSRLLVLASVYEAVLQSDSETPQVDIAALIETLVGSLRSGQEQSSRITLRTECGKLIVDVANAVPLGLIVNEAVTNALKHGFADDSGGQVLVTLSTSGETGMLTVTDDGTGFDGVPPDGGLGLRLMTSLSRQLRGTLKVDGSSGTRVELEWQTSSRKGKAARASAEARSN